MTTLDKLMTGAIDMHVHCIPDSLMGRRQDALQLAQSAKELGMRAMVIKSREYMTVPVALLVNQIVPDFSLFGSLTLDSEVGGLNPAAVLAAARMGAKVIWMPTLTAANSKAKTEKSFSIKLARGAQNILDSTGALLPEVHEILRITKEHDIILASGHLSPREIFTLAQEAKKVHFSKFVITHPLQGQLMNETLTNQDMKKLAQEGAFIEYCFWAWMPTPYKADPEQIVESVKIVGAEYCIMSSDLGQEYNPPAPEGLRLFIATMLRSGLKEKEIEIMVKTNPAKLLNLN